MGTLIRAVNRFIPWSELSQELITAREYEVRLVKWDRDFTINTPWACLPATGNESEEDLAARGGGFATAEEALAEGNRKYPHWTANEAVRDRLLTNKHHHGPLVGASRTADEFDLDWDKIHDYARGALKLPKGTVRHEIAARAFH